jgi:hypothetical protein
VQVLNRRNQQISLGVIQILGTGIDHNAGIAYGVTTLGNFDTAVTVGLGYAYSGRSTAPIVMIGGEYRQSRHVKWITENWIWHGGDGFVSGGIRFLGERLSADVGVVAPLIEDAPPFPIVNFVWKF